MKAVTESITDKQSFKQETHWRCIMENLGTHEICQIAIVVRDIEETAGKYASLFGLDRPEVRTTEPREKTNILYRGKPTDGRAKLAFFKMGGVTLELIEPVGGPSTWQEHLDEKGEGVHHIAFRVQGMDQVLGLLEGKGSPEVQRGDFKNGRYTYVDTTKDLKVVIELLESIRTE